MPEKQAGKERAVPLEWITLKEAAQYCRKSVSWAEKNWPSWKEYGVTAHREGRTLLFKLSEVRSMLERKAIN